MACQRRRVLFPRGKPAGLANPDCKSCAARDLHAGAGSLQIGISVATDPTNLVWSMSGTNLNLSWPADHTGWRLLMQTNHLAAGWRSGLHVRMNTATNSCKMPPLARVLVDRNAVQAVTDWINSLAGTPALASPDTNATPCYTLDGSLPTTNSFLYAAPLSLTGNLTLTASAFATGSNHSVAASALFTIQPIYFTSGGFTTNGQFQPGCFGTPGRTCVPQASTNLISWIPLNTNLAATNLFLLTDPGAGSFSRRFYRALQQ